MGRVLGKWFFFHFDKWTSWFHIPSAPLPLATCVPSTIGSQCEATFVQISHERFVIKRARLLEFQEKLITNRFGLNWFTFFSLCDWLASRCHCFSPSSITLKRARIEHNKNSTWKTRSENFYYLIWKMLNCVIEKISRGFILRAAIKCATKTGIRWKFAAQKRAKKLLIEKVGKSIFDQASQRALHKKFFSARFNLFNENASRLLSARRDYRKLGWAFAEQLGACSPVTNMHRPTRCSRRD